MTGMKMRMIVFGLTLVSLCAGGASAADVWRMAGSFNGWSTNNPAWELTPSSDEPGAWDLVREVPAGRHEFKFVRNGDWGAGHFGAAEAEGTLTEPGQNIVLDVPSTVQMRVSLRPEDRTWSVSRYAVDKPIIVTHLLGVPVSQRRFVVDLNDSVLLEDNNKPRFSVTTDDPDAVIELIPDAGPMTVGITPSKPGPLLIEVQLLSGGKLSENRFRVTVDDSYQLRHTIQAAEFTNDLEPLGGGLHRFMLGLSDRMGIKFASMSVLKNGEVIAHAEEVPVPIGDYVVEVRDGELTTAGDVGGAVPGWLLLGAWTVFEFTPSRPVESVHLVGDLNDWHGPGEERAKPLASRADGSWFTILNPPDGGHRYNFLLDGRELVVDPASTMTMPGPTGAPAGAMVIGPVPSDLPPVVDGQVNFQGTNHEPRLLRDFRPINAELGLVEISCVALPGDVERAMVVVTNSPLADPATGEIRVPMQRSEDLSGFDRWTARVMTGTDTVTYQLLFVDGDDLKGANALVRKIEPKPELPAWAMGAVWYQIFPERYRNANTKNDPHGDAVFAMDWNADWYETQAGEEAAWRERAGLSPGDPLEYRQGGDLFHWVWDRRYGGDLQGVQEKLEELENLGVTALYLNPIFEAESMHKYDATDFRHIDDNFASPGPVPSRWSPPDGETADPSTWTWTDADRFFIDEFLPAAHGRNMRVVLDGVFNHTGREHWAFKDVLEKGRDSEFADWYSVTFADDGSVESWVAWDAPSGWLPKFNQESDGNLVQPVRDHIFAITRRWMDPNNDGDPSDGIDGWRLDVALDVGLPFWEQWCALVREINPDALIIAEIWYDAHDVLDGPYFDTQMHYPFASAVIDWLGVQPGMTSQELGHRLSLAFNETPQTNLVHQNLFASHDTDRYVSMLLNPGRGYDQSNRIQDNGPGYKDVRPGDREYALAALGLAIQATYLGSPMVYYGDEYGMWGADDPTNRKPVPWADQPAPVRADELPRDGMRDTYAGWLRLRSNDWTGPVLRYGNVKHLETGRAGVFAFERRLNDRRVVVVANRENTPFDASALIGGEANTEVGPVSARIWQMRVQ